MAIVRPVEIVNELGLHLRAAGAVVRVATQFESDIFVDKKGQKANAKSIMGLLALAASKGTILELSVEGADEERAAEIVAQFFADGFVSDADPKHGPASSKKI